MAVLDFLRRKVDVSNKKEAHPFIITNGAKINVREGSAIVKNTEIKFPAGLGDAHPFDGEITKKLYKSFGLTQAAVDKHVDFIVGAGIKVVVRDKKGNVNERGNELIENFIIDNQFTPTLRKWVKEALIKPGGYINLGGRPDEEIKGIKVLDGNYIYVKRDDKGKIEYYNQWVGAFDKLAKTPIIRLEPNKIAALHFNCVDDSPYGLGIVSPTIKKVTEVVNLENDMHTIVHRKANNSLHIKVGNPLDPESMPSQADIDSLRNDAQTLTNKTEWITDAHTEITSVDTGNLNDKFDFILTSDNRSLIAAYQVPEVVLGFGNIPEGLAKVQGGVWERRIQSYQEETEKVLETQFFNRILLANGIKDVNCEVEWGLPGRDDIVDEMSRIKELLGLASLNSGLRFSLEKRLAGLFGFDEAELTEEEPVKPERPMDKPVQDDDDSSEESSLLKESYPNILSKVFYKEDSSGQINLHTSFVSSADPFSPDASVSEWLGFAYEGFIDDVRSVVDTDGFGKLKAFNSLELRAGKLSDVQIEKLRGVLKKGFERGVSMRDLSDKIGSNLNLKDALVMDNNEIKLSADGKEIVGLKAADRPMVIARTETTRLVSLANEKRFGRGGVTEYVWRTVNDGRVCPTCDELNSSTFKIGSGMLPPAHIACRCLMLPVVEGLNDRTS